VEYDHNADAAKSTGKQGSRGASPLTNRSDTNSKAQQGLRDRAEAAWQTRHREASATSPEEVARVVHELEVHQIELELQNEELRRAQQDLEESRHQFSDLYDFAPVGYLTINQDTSIVQANLTVAKMLGIDRLHLVGQRFTRFVLRDSQDAFYLAQRAVGADRPSGSCELVLRKADGAEFPVSMEIVRAVEPSGIASWRCAMTDITTRRAAERALRESEALRASEDRYRGLAEQVVDGILITDPTGRPLDANRAACDLWGYTLDELKTLRPEDTFSVEQLPRLSETFRRLATGEIVRSEWHFRRKDGSVFVGETVGRQLPDGRLQAVVRDITERKESEEVQRRLHQLAMLPLNNANVEEVLGAIVEIAIAVGHADFGNIQLLDQQFSRLRIVAQRGFPQWWIDYWQTISRGPGACGTALGLRERVIIEDVERSQIFTGADLDAQRKAGVRAVQSTPLVSRSGQIIGMLSTHFKKPGRPEARTLRFLDLLAREATDIIQHVQAETTLERQAALLDLAHDSILIHDAEGDITYWNESAARDYGWSKEEALGRVSHTLLKTQFPESLDRVLDSLKRTGHWEGELVHTCRDGRRITVDSRWTIQPDAEGKGFRILEINNDITQRKHVEAALRESEQQLQSYIDQAGDAIYVLDGESGRILKVNNRAAEMLGYSRDELLHLSATDIERIHTPVIIDDFHQLTKREVVEVEGIHQRKDGSTFPVEIRMTSLTPTSPHRILSVVRDISERKRLERERAAEARRKDEFLAFLGHELRNPLAAIHTATQVLSTDVTPSQRTKMQEIIGRQTAMMRRLVDDLLELERITHGHIELKPTRVDLGECLQQAVAAVQSTVADRRQELLLRLPSEPVQFMADGTRLDQIVGNLLTNASKYTGPGGRIELSGASEGSSVIIRCKDNGQGILPEYQQKIFEPFVRAPSAKLGYGEASVGLGLALVKQLTELHGGTISVESAGEGLGSEFTVRLPLVAPPSVQPEGEEPKPARVSRRLRSVVIVEDNPSVGTALKTALEQAGHSVQLFADGPSALAGASELKPDVFLIDIGLPGMDGYELVAKLKQQRDTKNVVRIAVSGRKRREQEGTSDDFDHYFTKPVDVRSLLTFLDGRP
jgi:PAS domain S-box-containing protein